MTDIELLEAAAKAACITERVAPGVFWGKDGAIWAPLTDDGDALRLAVKLEINIIFGANYVLVDEVQEPTVNNTNDKFLAVRHAIVRAAAEIGKKL